MTMEQYGALKPLLKSLVTLRCRERGIGIEDFPEGELWTLQGGLENVRRVAGIDLAAKGAIRDDAEVLREQDERELERFSRTIPIRYRDANLEQDFSARFVDDLKAGQSGVVVGGNGIGKTRLAWALAMRWKAEKPRCTVRIVKGAALLSEAKAVEGDWYRYIEDEYGRCDHLFIDEIDKIKGSEADWMLLTYLIDYRYEWCRQTVVMGNCSKDETLRLIGQSSYSRLSGDGARAYSLSGTDKRRDSRREERWHGSF